MPFYLAYLQMERHGISQFKLKFSLFGEQLTKF